MIKSYKTLFWGLAVLACIVLLSIRPQAAEYVMGPGDYYDANGNIVSLDGRIMVYADGSLADSAGAAASDYTVIGNGTGTDGSRATAEILNGVRTTIGSASQTAGTASTSSTASRAASQNGTISVIPMVITAAEGSASSDGAAGPGVQTAAESSETGSALSNAASPNYTVSGSRADSIYSFEGHRYKKSSLYGSRRLTGYTGAEDGSAGTASGTTAKPWHTASVPSDIPLGTVLIVEGTKGPNASQYTGMYVAEDRGSNVDAQGLIDLYFASGTEAYAVTANGWNYADVYIAEAIE